MFTRIKAILAYAESCSTSDADFSLRVEMMLGAYLARLVAP
jgi:hypothetical protein